MKPMKKFLFILVGMLVIVGCKKTDVFDENAVQELNNQSVKENATKLFGSIDPNQDWNDIETGSVTITADADLENIVKVQILTESPFMNPDARVLNEAAASNGSSVKLVYDTPKEYKRLIAACVDNNGRYYIKGFDISESQVSFGNNNSRRRKAAAQSYNFPATSNFVMPTEKSFISYNAIRAQRANQGVTTNNINLWKDSGWENDRMWRNNSSLRTSDANYKITYDGSDWYMQNFSIRRDLSNGLTSDEKTNLRDIFTNYLYWRAGSEETLHKNNLALIRKSKMIALYDNQFIANGEPVIITPVQATSSEMTKCDLYYYYYNPQDVAGMSKEQEVRYIQQLPKFMAMSTYDAMLSTNGSDEFYKTHEYVLPYYGESLDVTTLSDYTSDGKVYRIRNGHQLQGESYYMVYNSQENWRLATAYADDASNLDQQLWQVFKSSDGTRCYLYNVGARCFLYYSGNWNTAFTNTDYLENNTPDFMLIEDNGVYHFNRNSTVGLGSDLDSGKNKGMWSDKTAAKCGDCFDWYLDEYQGSRTFAAKTTVEKLNKPYTAQSFSIPAGYRIGFLMRKGFDNSDDAFNHYYSDSFLKVRNGDFYGDGRLNKQINRFPDHFMGKWNKDILEEEDPRIAVFCANNKMYATFEDGSDANFADLIVEISNGVELVADAQEVTENAYTLSFEDRPSVADYDMNDVVIRCTRKDKNTLTLTLVACGADDRVVIHGATGWAYNDKEVHDLFQYPVNDTDGHNFINTVKGGTKKTPLSAEVTVDENVSIADYLNGIYIENISTGNTIHVAKTGEPPFGIIIPQDFEYPSEKVSVITAYPKFINWARNASTDQDWYRYKADGTVYTDF